MLKTPPSNKFVTQHTIFSASYETNNGIRLQEGFFSDYQDPLTDPKNYAVTQQLGQSMREAKVGAFEYVSARDPDRGVNVALFESEALACKQPLTQQPWLCETSSDVVSFSSTRSGAVHHFPLEAFLVEGRFPQPAV